MSEQPAQPQSNPGSKPQDAKSQYAQNMRPSAPPDQKEIEESVLWKGGYSPKTMFGSWLVAAVVTIGMLIVLLWWFSGNQVAWYVVLGAILTIWTALFAAYGYHRLSHHYELTNQRLKHRDGILVQTTNRVEMIDVSDVMYRQGPIQNLLGVGHITVKSSDITHPELILKGIANVRQVADAIDDARRAERRRRGVFVESI